MLQRVMETNHELDEELFAKGLYFPDERMAMLRLAALRKERDERIRRRYEMEIAERRSRNHKKRKK